MRHAAAKGVSRLSAHDDHTAAFALAHDEFCADIQTHLGHPAIESGSAFQRNDENVTAFIGHAEGKDAGWVIANLRKSSGIQSKAGVL